jgi:hypothetical protein
MTQTNDDERAVSRRPACAVRNDAQRLAVAGADGSVARACALRGGIGGIGFRTGVDMTSVNARRRSLAAGGDP